LDGLKEENGLFFSHGKMTLGTDETQPLLRSVTNEGHQVYTDPAPPLPLQDGADIAPDETTIVDFDPNGDPENPLDWPAPFKWAVVSMLALMAFNVYVHTTQNF
jgi:hypothetical protein